MKRATGGGLGERILRAAPVPVILVRAGDHAGALVTEGMSGSREIVVRPGGRR